MILQCLSGGGEQWLSGLRRCFKVKGDNKQKLSDIGVAHGPGTLKKWFYSVISNVFFSTWQISELHMQIWTEQDPDAGWEDVK